MTFIMLPLVHNAIVRNRSSTLPNSTRSIHHSNSTTTISTTTNDTNTNQYGIRLNSNDSSDCKKSKSKVCFTFSKNRSRTLSSFFPLRSSRSSSTNSLQSSLVDETIASVNVKIFESPYESTNTQSEQNLNQYFQNKKNHHQKQRKQTNHQNQSINRLTEDSSTISNDRDENILLDNLVNSFSSDLNLNSTFQSTNELNFDEQSTPSFPPPSYTPIDPKPIFRRPPLLRSQSAPQHRLTSNSDLLFNNSNSNSNSIILENIQEIQENLPFINLNNQATLADVVEEDEDQTSMASRRNSYLNHRFNCRLAHNKEIITIPGFNTKEELYERISTAFKIDIDQILYCTLNSLEIDHLFDRHINFNDLIYVHIKGQSKEIEIEKSDPLLGLTICDNSNGLCLIKKIKDGSVIDKIKFINVGDIIERINTVNLFGYRHIDVANMLKSIPVNDLFVIRLIEPIRDTDESNTSQLGKQLKNKIKKGYETLRIRSKGSTGPPIFEEEDDTNDELIKKISALIEDFVGISDLELCQQILDIGKQCNNPHDFLMAINESDLKVFCFSDELIFDLWGCIRDSQTLM